MRIKNLFSGLLFTLLFAVVPSLAADYNVLVKNESTRNSGTNLYVRVRNSNQMMGGTCTTLSSYEDGSFYANLTMEEARTPTLTFYTRANCNGNSIATVRPFEGTDPVSKDIIITITNDGATLANSPDPITPPQTATPGGDRPGGPTGPGGGTTQTKRKVVRFFAPWTNTSAIIYVAGGDSAKMTTVKNYCGWFEARITLPNGSLQVYFKQTLGYEYVADIHNSIKITPITQSLLLSLDSAAANTDTIWVKAGKEIGSPTTVYDKYPGILGDCPVKTLPVMMFDWLHGELGDGDIVTTVNRRDSTTTTSYGNGAKDLYYNNPIYATSNDFGSGGCGGSNARDRQNRGYMAGMVEPYLGPNGVPVQAANFPENCKLTTHINQWFLPQVLAQKNGREYTNATCRSIELTLDTGGLWLGQKNTSSPEGGLFLLDDFQYLDEEGTIENPFFDNLSANRKRHNFGFTMKIQATFEYIPGQYFEFLGDDDVWVFINNRLVVDIGGQHQQVTGAVNLDTLNLIEGTNYPFHIFYAERHTSESNFKMRTSIDLKTEASILAKDLSSLNVINYEIYQRISQQALSCDFSGATQTDTVAAPSNFTLFGSGAYAEGVPLDSTGTWFGGITIKPGYTGFTIDTAQIKAKRALPPGTYQLRFSLQKDETQYDEITFVIDKYASLPIVYARVDNGKRWTSLGADVDGNVEPLNKESSNQWVNTRYPVNIMFEDGSTFDDMVYVNTSNPLFFACDENGNKITAVTLKNGKATFYVKATAPVQDVTILVASADEEQKSYWRHISFMEPPVPQVVFAYIFDRDGDGRGDSVYAKLNKPYGSTLNNNFVNMDSVQLEFGETFPTIIVNGNNIAHNDIDSSIAIVTQGGFGTTPFTGGATSIYSGKITPYWNYSEGGTPTIIKLTSDVTDSIGPVITAADISYSNDGTTILSLTFSEGLDCENEAAANYFKYFFKRTNSERDDIFPDMIAKDKKNKWKLIFRSISNDEDNIPVMNDSIKLVPGVHMDLLHRSTDPRNPFVRISGEQKVVVTSSPVVTIGEKEESREIIRSKEPTVTKLYQTDEPKTAKEVAEEYGVQGHYLGDMSLSNYAKDEVSEIEAAIKEANNKSLADGGLTLADRLATESIEQLNKKYKLGDNVVKAYREELIDANDLIGLTIGDPATKEKVKEIMIKRTTLSYETHYYTSLGEFVNNGSGTLSCTDSVYKGNCLDHEKNGKLFLAWNMKSNSGRLVGTGVYIARLKYKIKVGWVVKVNRTQDFLWGVRHGQTKGFEIDVNY